MTQSLHAAFDLVHTASRSSPAPSLKERRDRLTRLQHLLTDNRREIIAAISADFGTRAPQETELFEIFQVLSAIRHTRRRLGGWMRDDHRGVAWPYWPARAWVRHEPLGVVGIVAPWNYPVLLSLSPLVGILAAGNRALIKPSELNPAFGEVLSALIAKTFSAEEITVVLGDTDVAKAFTALPFDHLIFTGSTEVGRHVMRAAAENLTPVTLELGGKSPAIIAPDYSIEQAAVSLVRGKFTNGGQTCIAPDYVLVPEDQMEALARALMTAAAAAYPRIQENPQYTNILSPKHRAQLEAILKEVASRGSEVRQIPHSDGDKLAPTIVLAPPLDCTLMQEEIFGPILPLIPYKSLGDAIELANSFPRPLALYIFTHHNRTRDHVLDEVISGGVTVNDTLQHITQDSLPFGGVGASGMGAYHGYDGFKRFSHARAVYQTRLFSAADHVGPPWGRLADLVIKILGR